MSKDPNAPKILANVPTDIEAAAIVTALAAQGIEASTTGGFTAGFRAEAPGDVQIVVRAKDLPRAEQALGAMKKEPKEIDWSKVDVGEPEG